MLQGFEHEGNRKHADGDELADGINVVILRIRIVASADRDLSGLKVIQVMMQRVAELDVLHMVAGVD